MTRTVRIGLFLLALVMSLPPPGACGAADAPRAGEYSRSGGGTLKLKLATGPPANRPAVPKTLPELQAVAGDAFLCVKRENFLVASDIGPGEYEYLVDGVLDYCREALIRVYFDRARDVDRTVNIFIFRDYASYAAGLRRFLGMDPISPYGHYGHSQKYIVVNYETGPGTMVHELTHALMAEDFPEAPIWLAEGMACLYEHCRAEADQLRGDDNWRLPELKAALEGGWLTPLPVLLGMSPAAFREERESLNYAESRYFCKYLEELGLLQGIYKEFRERHAQDPTGARFVTKAFGKPLEHVETAWKRWITYQHWKE